MKFSEKCKIAVDKLTAHLTLTRLENKEDLERECNSQTNIKAINESIKKFIRHLENGKVVEKYKKDFEKEEIQERFKMLKIIVEL